MLVHLLSDYIRKKSVRDQYRKKPTAVLARYGVHPKQLGPGLAEALSSEVRALSLAWDGRITPAGWGIPSISITNYETDPAQVKAGEPFSLEVLGSGFTGDLRVAVCKTAGDLPGGKVIVASTTKASGTTKLIGRIVVPRKGVYLVGAVEYVNGRPTASGNWLRTGEALQVT